jgi:cytochrome P450
VGELEARVREVCDSLIDKFAAKGSCEFIADFAVPFPSYIFLAVVGLPLDLAPQFLAWENALMRGETPAERVAAARAVADYLEQFVKRQRKAPDTDFLRGLDAAEIEGRRLTDEEILGMLYTLYLGGLDTVYSTLGWMLRHLAMDQALQSRLRADPSLIPAAVDELARAYSVVSTRRRVAKDFDFHGVRMREGDLVVLPLYLAGRDPQTHERPNDIVLDRHSGRLTFATGPHHCLGAHLARREMKVALETLLGRFAHIRIPEGERYAYHTGVVFGVDRLPLTWDAPAG